MGWLTYAKDEVRIFHPEFESAANKALQRLGLDSQFKWVHHPSRKGASIYPDFSLVDKKTEQWIFVLEMKRRKESVYSTRNQYQAKSYAEDNAGLFRHNAPLYFAISNLESTILFAVNRNRPPLECQLVDGVYSSGSFEVDSESVHRSCFVRDMERIIALVVNVRTPAFEKVWPAVLDDLFSRVTLVGQNTSLAINTPNTPGWAQIQAYFGRSPSENATLLFLLRCLIAEFLRGTLERCGHPRSGSIPLLRTGPRARVATSVSKVIERLRTIDFRRFFEDEAPTVYSSLRDPRLAGILQSYISAIVDTYNVSKLARDRVDPLELLDSLFFRIYPLDRHATEGKIQTDPDLAELLATLVIEDKVQLVVDPCCGQGSLLSAAYNRLVDLGEKPNVALSSLAGIEADEVSARIASLRLALKNPMTLNPNLEIDVFAGDMFCDKRFLRKADAVVMNPPFKRYEAQDEKPVTPELREHYGEAIRRLNGRVAETTAGQANLFNYYVEYVVKAARDKTRIGIILDNKWYHNQYGESLRRLLLERCKIHSIVEYPHSLYFRGFTIATSILILEKAKKKPAGHHVRFVRCVADPLEAGLDEIAAAMHRNASWPRNWHENRIRQADLRCDEGWKGHFVVPFANDFMSGLAKLGELFEESRRGSLNKEEGGTGIVDFPFNRTDYGPQRKAFKGKNRRPFQTEKGRRLTATENIQLRNAVNVIPKAYRGWAIRNADDIEHYVLSATDVSKVQTIEPPKLRGKPIFFHSRRTEWTDEHNQALKDMKGNSKILPFINGLKSKVGLTTEVLPDDELWVSLREPYAGELIIPRKLRVGHTVHVNPYAFSPRGRQVRISSNFITYSKCRALDLSKGLNRETATRLIAAFLVSSFGQVQFEREGYNREGLRCVEKDHLGRMVVLDPRCILPREKRAILTAFQRLPYPISTELLSSQQRERNNLDSTIADVLCRTSGLVKSSLLNEVHESIDEWLEARKP